MPGVEWAFLATMSKFTSRILTPLIIGVSLALSILFFTLGVYALINLRFNYKLGAYKLGPLDEVAVNNIDSVITDYEWHAYNLSLGEGEFQPPKIEITPYVFELDIVQYKPNCSMCDEKAASFLLPGKCYYFTQTKHSFEECFQECRRYSRCYYFYAPTNNDISLIRHNAKDISLWVGAFKGANELTWNTLDNRTVPVFDIYGTYCSYINKDYQLPRTYLYCGMSRHCLCAGVTAGDSHI